jgi:hypothetical protein
MVYRIVKRGYADGHISFALQTHDIRGWWDVEGCADYTDLEDVRRMHKYLTLIKEEVVE